MSAHFLNYKTNKFKSILMFDNYQIYLITRRIFNMKNKYMKKKSWI